MDREKEFSLLSNLNYIITLTWKYDKTILFVFLIVSLLASLIQYINIFIPKLLLESLLNNQPVNYIIRLILLIAISILLLDIINSWLSSLYSRKASLARTECFSNLMMKKIFRIKYAFLENPEILNKIEKARFVFWSNNSGVEGTLRNLLLFVSGGVLLVGVVAICLTLNPIIPIVILGTTIANMFFTNNVKKKDIIMLDTNAPLDREMSYLQDNMSDASLGKEIRIFSLRKWLESKYLKCLTLRLDNESNIQTSYSRVGYISIGLTVVNDIIVYSFLVSSILNNSIRIDSFMMYLSAITSMSSAFRMMVESGTNIAQYTKCISDFRNVMDLPEEYDDKESLLLPDGTLTSYSISFRDVTFRYPGSEQDILSNLNLHIENGQNIAIIGINGAGKSTIVKLLTGLLEPDTGEILINNQNISTYPKQELYSMFSVVFQDIYQYAFTLAENIAFEDEKEIDEKKMQQAIVKSGLSQVVDIQPKGLNVMLRKDFSPDGITLSGGQAQNLALSRALYKDRPIVILDEPTAALDAIAEKKLYEQFKKLKENKTSIFISHRLASTQFCDRILLIDSGKIIEEGTHESLIEKKGLYAKMYKSQCIYYQENYGKEGER